MVKSILDPSVHYEEDAKISHLDKGKATALYEIEIHGQTVVIGLGSADANYFACQGEGITHYPIYLFVDDKPKARIGVYEIKTSNVLKYVDDDGDILIDDLEPLLFKFVTANYIKKSGSSPDFYYLKSMESQEEKTDKHNNLKSKESEKEKDSTSDSNSDSDSSSDSDSDSDTDIRKIKASNKTNTETVNNSVFEIDPDSDRAELLSEETEDSADAIIKEYVALKTHNWIQKFMENENYGILTNECAAADSFLCAVRDAFNTIGHKTTIKRLRDVIADNIDEDTYKDYLDHYLILRTELADTDREMRDIKKSIGILKTRVEKSVNRDEQKAIIEEANKQRNQYKNVAITRKLAAGAAAHYEPLKQIHSLEEFQKETRTGHAMYTDFALPILEKELNIKFIILENTDDTNSVCVLPCQRKGTFVNPRPKYYIVLNKIVPTSTNSVEKQNKYELVTYKSKRIFAFVELPYHLKTMIVNRCIEKNAGTFEALADFRSFRRKLGVKVGGDNDNDDDTDEEDSKNIFGGGDLASLQKRDIFVIHDKAKHAAPGTLPGERIQTQNLSKYRVLERVKDWRKALSDGFIVPFKVDGKRWQTVTHYYQGAKFKKQNPDFYKVFSLDSESDISKDVGKAVSAGSLKGTGRPKTIHIDPDFYGLSNEDNRADEERRLALVAKFNQNEDLRRTLLATKDAVLKKYKKGRPLEVDKVLMELRRKEMQ